MSNDSSFREIDAVMCAGRPRYVSMPMPLVPLVPLVTKSMYGGVAEVEFVTPGGSGKFFASGVNFSRNNAVCYINESEKLHFILISSLKLLTYY